MTQLFLEVVRRRARRFFRTAAEAESAAAEAIVELLDKLEHGEQPERAKVWALTAASNSARRVLNRQRAHVEFDSTIHHAQRQATLSEIQRCRELLERIHQMLLRMPALTQQAIVATAVDGRTIESVARELDVEAGTLRKQLTRVRRKFTRELNGREKFERLCELARQVKQGRQGLEKPHAHAGCSGRASSAQQDSSVASR